MVLTRIAIHGLRSAGPEPLELARTADLPAGAAGGAMADALVIGFASLRGATAVRALRSVDLTAAEPVEIETEGHGILTRVRGLDAASVEALAAPATPVRQLKISLELAPDPPLFGVLRRLAARDPRLVTGLGGDSTMALTVGWAFDPDLRGASVDLLRLAVGDVVIGLAGADRPPWVGELVAGLGGRLGRVGWTERAEPVAQRVLEASLSSEPTRRAQARRAADALAEAPFDYGRLELVRTHGTLRPAFGADLAAARMLGVSSVEALRLVEAVYVQSPDVLIVEAAGAAQADSVAVRGWLDDHIHGKDATLEQVLHLGGRT